MLNKYQPILLVLLFFAVQLSNSQNNTNSPYTRYGYGELVDAYSGDQRAMGGIGIAHRNKGSINAINPASYNVVDSMTFMFDVGFTALMSRFSDLSSSKNSYNSNLEYINLQFPIKKWLGFSAGLLPYSFSGYNFSQVDSIQVPNNTSTPTNSYFTKNFSGVGGISQVYSGLALQVFDRLSLGVNAYYMFGEVINNRNLVFTSSDFNSSTQINSIAVSSFRFRYGLQYYETLAEKHRVTVGLIYENKMPLNGKFIQTYYAIPADTLTYDDDFEMPLSYGVGVNYTFDEKLTVGLDYSMQQWGDALFFGKSDSLSNKTKLAVGAEFIPNPRGNKYLERVHYRGGFNIQDPYYKIEGMTPVKNFGISFGVGLPLRTGNSMINATFEYGKVGAKSTFREDYFKLTFNATFNETWFFKRKL